MAWALRRGTRGPMTLRTLLGILPTTLLAAGCAASSSPTTSEAAELAKDDGLSAVVTTAEVRAESAGCRVHLNRPVVRLADSAVTAAIGAALPVPTVKEICGELEEGETFDTEGGFGVVANAHGILSLSIGESSYMSGAGHMANSLVGESFDLHTGRQLHLRDVLDSAGLATLQARCVELHEPWHCELVLDEKDGPANFEIAPEGLRVNFTVPDEMTVPWGELTGAVKPVLAPFVANL